MAGSSRKNVHKTLKEEVTNNVESLVPFLCKPVEIYLVGSAAGRSSSWVEGLSDIDLLMLHDAVTLDEYVQNFQQIHDMLRRLSRPNNNDIYDIFLLNAKLARSYISCLPCVLDYRSLDEDNRVLSYQWSTQYKELSMPSLEFRQKLYIAKAVDFYNESKCLFPVVDGGYAKKQAKAVLRCLRVLTCVYELDDLEAVERRAIEAIDLDEIVALFEATTGLPAPALPIMQKVLKGESVADWMGWIEEQESFLAWLQNRVARLDGQTRNDRFYSSVYKIWDMLTIDVKRVLAEPSNRYRLKKEFVDKGLRLLACVEVIGGDSLSVFDETSVALINESQNIVESYLTGDEEVRTKTLASVLILLEHAISLYIEKSRLGFLPT